ncbi:MAG: 2-phospho-L-lactate transferase [Solirubrobacterales bacterium]|jgi:LPPG:FO 2-phospho-L-lactate transferase|nr:2-phospho-L-lactate transferase [Solirubrobacterales bacterium]
MTDTTSGGVVVLAGGTGGAKLAAGMQGIVGERLSVVANTGDDIETLGVHVSPDPDLVAYWLAGEIDEERGWGLRGDSFTVFEQLTRLGAPDWFSLSDRDLAACLYRRQFLEAGGRHTAAQDQIARSLGVAAKVLPMSDEPVRTRVRTEQGWRPLQEFLILDHGAAAVEAVELDGIGEARPTAEVLAAIAAAEAIVIGPSNPVISIGPILAVPGLREAIAAAPAPVVAVSPFIAGRAVKGPTDAFMSALGVPCSAAGIAQLYAGLLDGLIYDPADPGPAPSGVPTLVCETLMDSAETRVELADRTLEFARELRAVS